MNGNLETVPFYGRELYVTEHAGEPFTPVRPIVEGMGLGWSPQRRKLMENEHRWGVVMLITPSASGDQETLCIPVRKLPGYLATINPKKVAPELRERIELFQDECDDALWAYWRDGHAGRPGAPAAVLDEGDLINLNALLVLSRKARLFLRDRAVPVLEAADSPWTGNGQEIQSELGMPEIPLRNRFAEPINRALAKMPPRH